MTQSAQFQQPAMAPVKTPWWKSPIAIGAVSLLVGIGIGAVAARGGSPSTASPQAAATVTATVTATPEADPLASPAIVEGEPTANAPQPGSAKFTLGQPYTLSDGSVLTIGPAERHKPNGEPLGTEGHDVFVRLPVTLTNNGSEPVNPFLMSVQATAGTGQADSFPDEKAGCGFETADILPGKTREWAECFAFNTGQDLTIQWSYKFTDKGYADVPLP